MKVKIDSKIPEYVKKIEENQTKFLHSAGVIIHGQAVLLSEVDTGLQRNSITYSVGNDGKIEGLNSYGGKEKATKEQSVGSNNIPNTVNIGTNVIYAPRNEFKYKPFLRPALDYSKNKIIKLGKQIFGDALKR